MRRIRSGLRALAITAALAAACGGSDYAGEKDACKKLKGAPAGTLVATADPSGAPMAQLATRYQVVLPPEAVGAYVGFRVDTAGKHTVFLDAAVPTAVYAFAAGAGAPAEAKQSGVIRNESDECDQVRHMHQIDISAGEYFVRIGPATESQVNLVVE